jgi:hypothetical protein
VVLLLALGVTDIGRAFYYREAVTNSVRQALRVAVSPAQQATADSICSSTGSGPVAVTVSSPIPPAGGPIATIANEAALESSSDGTPAGSVIAGSTLSITFHCLNGVTATITDRMRIVTVLLWPIVGTSVPITVSSFQRSEY